MSQDVLATNEVFQAIYLDLGAKPKQKVVFLEPMFDTEPPGIIALKSLRLENRWGLLLTAPKLRLVDFQDKYSKLEKKIHLGKDFDPKDVLRHITDLAEEMDVAVTYVQKGQAGKTVSGSAQEFLSDYAPDWFWKAELNKVTTKDVRTLVAKLESLELKPEQRTILTQWAKRNKPAMCAAYYLAEGVADQLTEPVVAIDALSVWTQDFQEVKKKATPKDVIFSVEASAVNLVSIPDSTHLVAARSVDCEVEKKTFMMGVGWMAEIRPKMAAATPVAESFSIDLYKPVMPLELEVRALPNCVAGEWLRIPGGIQKEVQVAEDSISGVLTKTGHQILPSGTAIAEIENCISTWVKKSDGYSWVVTPKAHQVEAILRKKFRSETERSEWALLSRDGSRVLKWFGPRKPSHESVLQEERRIQYFKHAK